MPVCTSRHVHGPPPVGKVGDRDVRCDNPSNGGIHGPRHMCADAKRGGVGKGMGARSSIDGEELGRE